MFFTIQRENILPSKKEINKAITMLITRKCALTLQNSNCPIFALKLWITTSPYRWPIGSLPSTYALYSPRTALWTFTPRRDQLVICGQYVKFNIGKSWKFLRHFVTILNDWIVRLRLKLFKLWLQSSSSMYRNQASATFSLHRPHWLFISLLMAAENRNVAGRSNLHIFSQN
jgi:hypothetical protein